MGLLVLQQQQLQQQQLVLLLGPLPRCARVRAGGLRLFIVVGPSSQQKHRDFTAIACN